MENCVMNPIYKLIERIYLATPNNLVYYDSLTNVHSRVYYDRVCKKKYLDKEIVVCYFDINQLKVINDTEGHSAGNRLIKLVANQIKLIPNVMDICRLHGDEFCCFIHTELFDVSNMLSFIYNQNSSKSQHKIKLKF